MKKNILILGSDYSLSKNVAQKVAGILSKHFLDVDELINYELIDRDKIELRCGIKYLQQLEQNCIKRIAEFDDCVACIGLDTFLSDNVAVSFNNFLQFFLDFGQNQNKNVLYKDISAFFKNSCNIYINCDNLSIDKIADIVIKKLF